MKTNSKKQKIRKVIRSLIKEMYLGNNPKPQIAEPEVDTPTKPERKRTLKPPSTAPQTRPKADFNDIDLNESPEEIIDKIYKKYMDLSEIKINDPSKVSFTPQQIVELAIKDVMYIWLISYDDVEDTISILREKGEEFLDDEFGFVVKDGDIEKFIRYLESYLFFEKKSQISLIFVSPDGGRIIEENINNYNSITIMENTDNEDYAYIWLYNK